jgi:hypothetical protein
MDSETWTVIGLDPSGLAVVAIGVATIATQLYAARKGAGVAERQAKQRRLNSRRLGLVYKVSFKR